MTWETALTFDNARVAPVSDVVFFPCRPRPWADGRAMPLTSITPPTTG